MTGGPLVADCCFVISPTAGDWGLISATILPGNSWRQWFRILISSFGCHRPSGVAMWWAADRSTPLQAMGILANTFTLLHSVNKLKKKLFIHGFLFESGTMICIQTGADSNEKNDQSVWNLTEFQIVLYHSIALGKLYTFPFERRPIRQRTWLRNHENSI